MSRFANRSCEANGDFLGGVGSPKGLLRFVRRELVRCGTRSVLLDYGDCLITQMRRKIAGFAGAV
jgi:hypothetical protein